MHPKDFFGEMQDKKYDYLLKRFKAIALKPLQKMIRGVNFVFKKHVL